MCSNYREVSLQIVAGKWFGKVLNTRLRVVRRVELWKSKVGFRQREAVLSKCLL